VYRDWFGAAWLIRYSGVHIYRYLLSPPQKARPNIRSGTTLRKERRIAIEKQLLGCCGLDCKNCPVYIAAMNNNDELRVKTAKEFSELYAGYLGGHQVKPEDVNCRGCNSESGLFIGGRLCPIKKCCR